MTKTSAPKTSVGKSIVSVKVTLLGTKPPVWRRLLMLDTMTLADLRCAIQAAMGMGRQRSPMSSTLMGGTMVIGAPLTTSPMKTASLSDQRCEVRRQPRSPTLHDFGDSWEHVLVIEKAQPTAPGQAYPEFASGRQAGACAPRKDSGGHLGYQQLLEVLADPDRSRLMPNNANG